MVAMKRSIWTNYWLGLLWLLVPLGAMAQDSPSEPADTSEQERVVVDHADLGEYLQEGERLIQMLMKQDRQVELRQGDAFMYCDTAIIEENDVVAYGNVIIQQGDSLNVFADSVVYLGDSRTADLFGDVILETNEQRLFTNELNYQLDTKTATYFSGALLANEQTQLTSKRGYYYVDEKTAYFKDSVVVIDEEFSLQADTLQFNTESKVATFLGPTLIRQDSAMIYCEAGYYDTANRTAEFRENAQYGKGEQEATALVIRYDGDREEVTLSGEARFVEGTKNASADTILYNDGNDLTVLRGNAVYRDEGQLLESDRIVYNTAEESFQTEGRSRIYDEAQILEADQIDFDTESEIGIATGNVYWVDTVEQVSIRCENANYNKANDYLKATGGRPLMTSLVDGDTLYLSADTLISYRVDPVVDTILTVDSLSLVDSLSVTDSLVTADPLPGDDEVVVPLPDTLLRQNRPKFLQKALDSSPLPDSSTLLKPLPDSLLLVDSLRAPADSLFRVDSLRSPERDSSTARNLLAQRNVKIYKSDLQAVCDSLVYSTVDSLFEFYGDPVIWSDTSQFDADTIHMQLANDQIDRIYLYQDAFILNSPDELFFNQIKGRDIVAYFVDGEVRRVKVDGNAESVYYALDEAKAYVAANKTVCSEMMLFFGNNEIEKINFFRQPTAEMQPMDQANHDALRLPGFDWQVARRPQSVADLLRITDVVSSETGLEGEEATENGGEDAGEGEESEMPQPADGGESNSAEGEN